MVLDSLDKNLVLHLGFEEGSGAKAHDKSQAQNNGDISGAIFVKPYEDMSDQSDDEGDNPLVIYDDDETFWTDLGNTTLSEETTIVKKGTSSLKIVVSGGLGTIGHSYGGVQDFTQYDYITFWWYGTNSSSTFYLSISNIGITKYFTMGITDNFSGWKRFLFPLDSFDNTGSMTWDAVELIRFNGIPNNVTMYLDRFTFDVGNWRFGEAMDFDGTNDYVNVPADASYLSFDDFTISFWFNPFAYSDGATDVYLFDKFTGAAGSILIQFPLGQPEDLWFGIRDSVTYRSVQYTIPNLNTWYHIVCAYKRNEYMKLYVDGQIRSARYDILDETQTLNIDINISEAIHPFNGLIDEVKVYNIALTAEEVMALYKQVSRR